MADLPSSLPQATTRNHHEGEIIRVPRVPLHVAGQQPSRQPVVSSRRRHHRHQDAAPAADAGRPRRGGDGREGETGREGGDGDGDDLRSVLSAASSAVSALTMGTASAHVVPGNVDSNSRAKPMSKAAVINQDYGGGGSAVGIDIDLPADVADGDTNNNNNGTTRNAAQQQQQQQRKAHTCRNSNRNRPAATATATAAAAAAAARASSNGSHNRRGRFRPSSHRHGGAVALPILAEDSDSDGSDGVEDANHIGNNSNNTCIHSHGHHQTHEPTESTSTDRPHPRSVGRTNTRVPASAPALASATDGSRASTPYVTDIGYSDDDARHAVAPQLWTWWDGDGGSSARWWYHGCCDGRMTVTNKRMVGIGLLLLSALIVVVCAVGFRNNNNSSKEHNVNGGSNHGPGLEEEERPTDNDSLLPGGGNRLNEPTAAPTPWTVPEYQPTVPVGSSSVCSSPIVELPTDNNLQSGDKLGTSLAMDRAGRTIVAGAPNADNLGSNAGIGSLDTGAAFVYALPAVGGDVTDAQVTKLVAADGVRGMGFGTSVAMSDGGDVIVIGAPSVDVDFIDKVGAAYVFRKKETDGLWYEEARLVPSEPTSRMQFGRSVAINEDGTRIVVGAPGSRRQANGSVTIFTYKSDGGWEYTTHIPDKDSDEAMFGLSVDISNDYVVVGAPLAGYRMEGEAYLFSADAAWDPVAMFTGFNGRDEFGVAVSIDGDRIAIGSQFANTQFGYNSGSVYLYKRNNANDQWEPEVQISRVGMVTEGYKFGSSVDLTGTRLIAGAPGNSAAYVFALEGNAWKETQRMEHSDGSFGTRVAVSSNSWNAVGDPSRDDSAGSIFATDNCRA